jgi:hypothetical protein
VTRKKPKKKAKGVAIIIAPVSKITKKSKKRKK